MYPTCPATPYIAFELRGTEEAPWLSLRSLDGLRSYVFLSPCLLANSASNPVRSAAAATAVEAILIVPEGSET